jgi:FkbH-like protein
MADSAIHQGRCAAGRAGIKCVVWDLDNTIWDGVLLEDPAVKIRSNAVAAIRELDERGILHSVASRNDPDLALAKLDDFGIGHYFLYPEIGWGNKSVAINTIAKSLNIGTDALAFIDDDRFELDEVSSVAPDVLCINAEELDQLTSRPELMPRFVTEESQMRRLMYKADIRRNAAEKEIAGPKEEFLADLQMKLSIARAEEMDLRRAEELTLRTNQLNTTGYTFSYEELNKFRNSLDHILLVAKLEDRYGPYGTIGLCLVQCNATRWTIRLLLMSCRVMSRGVGTIVINYLRKRARSAGVSLEAEFIPNGRNRMMYMTYKLSNFSETGKVGEMTRLVADLKEDVDFPDYIRISLPMERAL